MAITLFSSTGQIDLSLIDPAEVLLLDEPRKEALNRFISAVLEKGKAEIRHHDARKRVHLAMSVEADAMAAHVAANPPPSRIEAMRAAQAAYRASH
jgi:hypothetical protein